MAFPSRHWQDLGYLIIYVTGRPDMQKQRVVAWLAQHNFPHGIVSFCDGLVHDPLRHKANFLKSLITDVSLALLKGDRAFRLLLVQPPLSAPVSWQQCDLQWKINLFILFSSLYCSTKVSMLLNCVASALRCSISSLFLKPLMEQKQ